MEAMLFMQNISPFSTGTRWGHERLKKKCPSIVSVLTRPISDRGKVSPSSKSVYKDNWFDLIAIKYVSHSVQASTGLRNNKSGYDSFVEAAIGAWCNFNPVQQHEIVKTALDIAFPKPILAMIRTLLPNSKFTREHFAVFTTVFFAWLVGPNEVRESEINGERERNVVHIKKCRFLEESNCVGMCINLCKMPSQTFIKDSLGMPVNMIPNFDDMSCEMIFGQEPPSTAQDPAFKQPCYKLCKVNKRHSTRCLI